MNRRGLLIILSPPSGAGKSTLARRLMRWDPLLDFSVFATTRPPRAGEVEGKDYYFLSDADFRAKVHRGQMLEHAHVFGHFYGSPKSPVETAISQGRDVLFDIDWQGAQQIANSGLQEHVLSIFILPPTIAELERRLRLRGQDDDAVITRRMQKSWDEISHWDAYDFVMINDDLDATTLRLQTIIESERLRRKQQPNLLTHVRRLQGEYGDRI